MTGDLAGHDGASDDTPLVPRAFADLTDRDASWVPWLEGLPRLARDVLADWELTRDGAPRHGECALVLPVRTADDVPAALKLTWPHDEARHEHLALQHWHGRGAVELLRADPHRWALLLERAGPADLTAVDDVTACAEVGALYRHLHRPALPQLPALSTLARDWARRLLALPRDAPAPRRLVERAAHLADALAAEPDVDAHVIHADLHHQNVLASTRAPWLAIDPKPVAGDPHLEPAPLLWNRWDAVVASGDVRWAVRRRLDAVVDAAGLDPDRARDWAVVRSMVNVLWCVEAVTARGERPDAGARAWVTRAVAIAKAVQD